MEPSAHPKRKRGSKNSRTSQLVHKRKLRTCEDVINRLRWNSKLGLDPDQVMIEYRDDILGGQELPVSSFRTIEEGGDIPMHRIKSFRFGDICLWDKATRLDRIFGSGNTDPSQRWVAGAAGFSNDQPSVVPRSLPPLPDGPPLPIRRFTQLPEDRQSEISKKLKRVMHHTALENGLQVYADGYIPLDDVLACPLLQSSRATVEDVRAVVQHDPKQRFSMVNKIESSGAVRLFIRANRRHSRKMTRITREPTDDFQGIVLERNLASEVPLVDVCVNIAGSKFPPSRLGPMIRRARVMNVQYLVVAGVNLNHSVQAAELCREHAGMMRCSVGVHPHQAACPSGPSGPGKRVRRVNVQLEIKRIVKNFRDVVGCIGECGLDFNRNLSPPEDQKRIFEEHIQVAIELQLPLLCHERDAHNSFVEILRKYCQTDADEERVPVPVLIHCFTGSYREAEEYLRLGCYLGFTTFISQSKNRGKGEKSASIRNVRALLRSGMVPLERIMLETDSPYQKPHFDEQDGNLDCKAIDGFLPARNEPCLTVCALNTLHALLGGRYSKADIARQTTENAMRFFGFSRE